MWLWGIEGRECGAGRCESVARERGRGKRMGGVERGEREERAEREEREEERWGSARAIKSRLFVRADGFGVGGEAGFGMSAGRVCNGRVFLSGVRRPVNLRRTGTYVPAGSVFR